MKCPRKIWHSCILATLTDGTLIHSQNSLIAPPVDPVSATTFNPLTLAILTASIKFLLLPDVVIGIKKSLLDNGILYFLEKID